MKKAICTILTAFLLCSSAYGCRNQNNAVVSSSILSSPPKTSDRQTTSSDQHPYDIDEESYEKLPVGIERIDDSTLKFKINSSRYSVIFPSEFWICNGDYTPERGIYLQNDEGTATLLMEAVEDNFVDNDKLADYLKAKYPKAELLKNENDVVITAEKEDNSGNRFTLIQKITATDNGYVLAAISCQSENKKSYQALCNVISIIKTEKN